MGCLRTEIRMPNESEYKKQIKTMQTARELAQRHLVVEEKSVAMVNNVQARKSKGRVVKQK